MRVKTGRLPGKLFCKKNTGFEKENAMNKKLAFHVEQDYLIAGVEPLIGKFYQLTKRGKKRYPFYFFVDKINNRVDYSEVYKAKYQDQRANAQVRNMDYFGDFLQKITNPAHTYSLFGYENDLVNLILPILDDIKDSYFSVLRSMSGDEISGDEPVALNISFSDNVPNKSRQALQAFLEKQNFRIEKQDLTFPELLVYQYMRKNGMEFKNKKFALLEAVGTHLNMSVVSVYTPFDREREYLKTFENFGADPRTQVIAKRIVDDINRQEGLLQGAQALLDEYERHRRIAEDIIQQIEHKKRPYISVETEFAIAPERKRSTTLSVDEIENLTFAHIRQISRYFESHFLDENKLKTNDFDKIFLVGDTLNNELVKKEFARFGHKKVEYLTTDDCSLALMALLFDETKAQEDAEKFQQMQEGISRYTEVEFVSVSKLKPGQLIKLSNHDPRPGKGDSLQEFKYAGENQFVVLQSTRSLIKGDIATAITPIWVPGMQIELKIERDGKLIGTFKTRKIVKIEKQD